jgi:cytochrome c551/c552
MSCHDGSNPHLPNLNGFDNVKKVTEKDQGAEVFTLVRVSHIHLFGLTFIFFLMGIVFSHAYVRPVWLKCLVMVSPFAAVVIDILSWYFTKLWHPFAWVVMGGGALYGASFAFMWFVSMADVDRQDAGRVAQRAQGARCRSAEQISPRRGEVLMKRSILLPAAPGTPGAPAFAADGPELLKAKGCLNCHDIEKKKVGPAYKDVAAKYKGDADASAKIIPQAEDRHGPPDQGQCVG